MSRVAIYTRVSTDDQDAENQARQLREWAKSEGHKIVAEHSDVASGARHRESLDDLYDAARDRRFEILAIWSLDRLTRQGPLQTLLYVHRFDRLGVRVFSHQETYLDPGMPFYSSILALIADVAKMERDRLIERTKAGQDRARAQGKHIGRPRGAKDKTKRRRRQSRKGGV